MEQRIILTIPFEYATMGTTGMILDMPLSYARQLAGVLVDGCKYLVAKDTLLASGDPESLAHALLMSANG